MGAKFDADEASYPLFRNMRISDGCMFTHPGRFRSELR